MSNNIVNKDIINLAGDGFPRPWKVVSLSMGDELQAYEQSIVVGPAVLFFSRNIKEKDIEAVITIYTMGIAARSRLVSEAYTTFMNSITSVEIVGY